MVDNLTQKCKTKVIEFDTKIEELWKFVLLSDKITEKLGAEGNKQIEDLRKAVDSLMA